MPWRERRDEFTVGLLSVKLCFVGFTSSSFLSVMLSYLSLF